MHQFLGTDLGFSTDKEARHFPGVHGKGQAMNKV